MELTKGQALIVEKLMLEPLDVQGLMEVTDLSSSFIRNQLRYMEATGQVEKVDKRIPHIYRIPVDNPLLRQKAAIEEYVKALATLTADTETIDPVLKLYKRISKAKWLALADEMEASAIAVRKLNSQGKLIETLAD